MTAPIGGRPSVIRTTLSTAPVESAAAQAPKPAEVDQFRDGASVGQPTSQAERSAFLALNTATGGRSAIDFTEPPAAPESPEQALDMLSTALASTDAFVNLDPEGRLLVSFPESSQAAVETAALQAGVTKSSTGIRDLFKLGAYEVILSPEQGAAAAW